MSFFCSFTSEKEEFLRAQISRRQEQMDTLAVRIAELVDQAKAKDPTAPLTAQADEGGRGCPKASEQESEQRERVQR